MPKKIDIAIATLTSLLVLGCDGLKPLPSVVEQEELRRAKFVKVVDTNRVGLFFDENYAAGGYPYMYPENSSKVYVAEEMGKEGEVSLCFDLDADDYSGGAVVLHSIEYNLEKYYANGAIEFWVRGSEGGEKAYVTLADDETGDGIKSEIKVPLDNYGGIQPYWTYISIPLADFGTRGAYWDEKAKREIKFPFDWKTVKEFLMVIEKGDQKKFKVYVDNVSIMKDRYKTPQNLYAPYWDEIKYVVPNRPQAPTVAVKILDTLYEGNFKEPQFGSVYGAKTAFSEQATDNPAINPHVMGLYFDNSDYSGINLNFARTINLETVKKNGGGLGFWARFDQGVTQAFLGIYDSNEDGKSVGSSVLISDFGKVDTSWNYFMVPLKEFGDEGRWWDENTKSEQPGTINWATINEVSVTTDKYGNRIAPGSPTKIFIDQIAVIESVPGYKDPEAYWNTFTSKAPDRIIFDFEDRAEGWEGISGEQSMISALVLDQTNRELREKYGRFYLQMSWSLNDWAFIGYPLGRFHKGTEKCDWSKHSALRFDVFSNRDIEKMEVKIKDAGKEEWTATVSLKLGWNEVELPFRKLRKYAYYQEPGAVVDGVLDLTSVIDLSFAPQDVGVDSKTLIDNITLTQESKK